MNETKKWKQEYNKYIVAHEWQKAIEVLDTIIVNNPQNPQFLLRRAMVFYRLQKWEEALIDSIKALALDDKLIQAQKIKNMVSAKLNKSNIAEDNLIQENDITIDGSPKQVRLRCNDG